MTARSRVVPLYKLYKSTVITVDIYGDMKAIMVDCLDELEPFIEDVLPKEDNTDYSDQVETDTIMDNYFNEVVNS